MQLILNQFNLFLLIVVRMTGIFAFAPFWGSRNIPVQVKIGLSFLLAFILFPIIKKPDLVVNDFFSYLLYIIAELTVGLIIGYTSMLILMAIQFAGELIDIQMGLSIVSVFDPQSSTSMPLMGQFKYLLALLFFLALDGHHQIIIALFNSYKTIPLMNFHYSGSLLDYILFLAQQLFITAFCLSAPILGTLFIIDVVLAIMTRTVPQLNIFVIGFPIKIAVGMIFLILVIPLYFNMLNGIFNQMTEALAVVINNFR